MYLIALRPRTRTLQRSVCWRTVGLLLTLLAEVSLSAFTSRRVDAQGITLPTVRAFGPGPEEAMLYRLLREVRAAYSDDTLAENLKGKTPGEVAAVRRRTHKMFSRLDVLSIASVTQRLLELLGRVKTANDSLSLLAADKAMPDDPVPMLLFRAIQRIADDTLACMYLDDEKRSKISAEVESRLKQQWQLKGIDPAVATKAVRVQCAVQELRERAPSKLLSAVRTEESELNRPLRASALDTLARVATAVVILRKINSRTIRPITTREQAAAFWRQRGFSPLNVGSISGSSKAGTTFTELASPLLQVFRVSVNAVLAAEKKENKPETSTTATETSGDGSASAVQRLLTGGGLFNISFAYPVLYKDWLNGATDVMLLAVPRFGMTAPILGATSADSATINLDAGLELHAKLLDFEDGVGVVTQIRWANARGSRNFVSTLGLPNKHALNYATASVGFLFGKQYLVSASKPFGGPKVIRNTPWQVGLTIIRLPSP